MDFNKNNTFIAQPEQNIFSASSAKNTFMVPNAISTCYIDALIMALFFTPSHISNRLLNCDPTEFNAIYLQELIKEEFINKVRNYHNVTIESIDIIRSTCFHIGWQNFNEDEYYAQQDISEFYEFLVSKLDNTCLKR